MNRNFFRVFFIASFFLFVVAVQAQTASKPPVIVIPGLLGSELINKQTGETVWFKTTRAKDDDLRLPISPNPLQNRDNLVPRDILRGFKAVAFLPESEIYQKLIEALQTRGGYLEGNIKNPPKTGYENTFYIFAYDWRLDNVENARNLIRQVETLKRKLKRPNLKFDIIAHSMGGLIARYAAMYGNADLPAGNVKLRPTWAGAKDFNKIFLLGTPNQGSILALNSLINGYSFGGIRFNLPFLQNLSQFDMFTIPAMYQLLPHQGKIRAFDENLQPLDVDVYDVKTWEKYGWSAIDDKNFAKNFTAAEQENAKSYFAAVLRRAERFQAALDANANPKIPVSFYLVGADCRDTLDGVVIYRDEKKGVWRTQFDDNSFKRGDGAAVSKDDLKKLLYAPGDSVVPKRSLGDIESLVTAKSNLQASGEIFQCEVHNKLVTNEVIQDKLLEWLLEKKVN